MLEITEVKNTKSPDWVILVFAHKVDADGNAHIVKDKVFSSKLAKTLKLDSGSKISFTEA